MPIPIYFKNVITLFSKYILIESILEMFSKLEDPQDLLIINFISLKNTF